MYMYMKLPSNKFKAKNEKLKRFNLHTLRVTFLALIFTLYALSFTFTNAQGLGGVVNEYPVADNNIAPGDIVISSEKGLIRTNVAYDANLFGVAVEKGVVVFKAKGSGNTKPVSRSGIASVKVTTVNGPIKVGDYVTSSSISGYGMKVATSGQVLGTAMESFNPSTDSGQANLIDYNPAKPTKDDQPRKVATGTIQVAIQIEYKDVYVGKTAAVFNSLGNRFGSIVGNVAPPEKFADAAKYVVAGVIAIGSFLIGFLTFARTLPKGVEALGRNPLAHVAIQFSIVLHIIFTAVTTLMGVIAAILIIRL